MTPLRVFWDEIEVGRLEPTVGRDYVFVYAPSYLARPGVRPISVALPLQPETFAADLTAAWFGNLLPEGEVRGHVARRLGVSERNDLALLAGMGGECAGAISIVPADLSIAARTPRRELLSWIDLEATVNRTPRPSLLALMLGGPELRLSLAGAQDKLPVCLDGDVLSLPAGGEPSTHLLKVANTAFAGLVENELFCLEVARRVGLPVPQARLAPTATPMLLVERYDRMIGNTGRVMRLHQEDLCQALGVPAESKYEAEGGPSLAEVFGLVTRVSSRPLVDRRDLLRWVLFDALIGNADAHAKNVALVHGTLSDKSPPVLAPFYDLVCTAVYPELSRRQAMKIGGEARCDRIEARHWQRFAEAVDLRPAYLRQEGLALCQAVLGVIHEMKSDMSGPPIVVAVMDAAKRHARRLWSDLDKLSG